MWTVGVMASWSPFSGGAELAQRRVASADARAAQAGNDAARGVAALEVRSGEVGVAVAMRTLAIATNGVAQASEAHRIVGRKYDGGLAAVSELLDAQAAELGARMAEARARHDLLLAEATLARARGQELNIIAAAFDAAAGIRE
jgi:outer membrane protein TolC